MRNMPDNRNSTEAATNTPDLVITGNPDTWVVVCKGSSKLQGWMKSTKVMVIKDRNGNQVGLLYQVSTEHRDPSTGVVTACAEALAYVSR